MVPWFATIDSRSETGPGPVALGFFFVAFAASASLTFTLYGMWAADSELSAWQLMFTPRHSRERWRIQQCYSRSRSREALLPLFVAATLHTIFGGARRRSKIR